MTFEEAFYWAAAWYNGQDEYFNKVIIYLQSINTSSCTTVKRPDFIKSDGTTPELELFWMILVQLYGDYGTSPRSGWIYIDNLEKCVENLIEIRRKTWCADI